MRSRDFPPPEFIFDYFGPPEFIFYVLSQNSHAIWRWQVVRVKIHSLFDADRSFTLFLHVVFIILPA